jgi:DUF177 domain-containing protein
VDSPVICIETSQIGEDGFAVSGDASGDLLDLTHDPVAKADGPVHYELTVETTGQDLLVRGRVEAPLQLRCSRCAQFFSTTATVSSFLHAYDWEECPESLDISTDVREDLLMEIPGFPLCDTRCKGLCPHCGQDLNVAPCGCAPPEEAPSPWFALDGLKDISDSEAPEGGPDQQNK